MFRSSVAHMTTVPMNGRRAQAARNDERILDAARAVWLADPGAPIAAVAERAGVGIGALYRRHGSKEDLLCRICADAIDDYVAIAEAALADPGDPGEAFARFVRVHVDADTHAIRRLGGTFTPTPEMFRAWHRAEALGTQLVERAQAADALRADVVWADMGALLEQITTVVVPDDEPRTAQMRRRYAALLLDALLQRSPEPLPGPVPRPREFTSRWYPG